MFWFARVPGEGFDEATGLAFAALSYSWRSRCRRRDLQEELWKVWLYVYGGSPGVGDLLLPPALFCCLRWEGGGG